MDCIYVGILQFEGLTVNINFSLLINVKYFFLNVFITEYSSAVCKKLQFWPFLAHCNTGAIFGFPIFFGNQLALCIIDRPGVAGAVLQTAS